MLAVYDTTENGLTVAQEKVINKLLTGTTIANAARGAEVGRSTIHAWLNEPAFLAELRRREGLLVDVSVRRLLMLQDDALNVVASIMQDTEASASTRLRAATVILDSLLRLRELRNLEERLAALEAVIHA